MLRGEPEQGELHRAREPDTLAAATQHGDRRSREGTVESHHRGVAAKRSGVITK